MKSGKITSSGGPVQAAREFLKGLIVKGIVDEVMTPAVGEGGSCSIALFADAEGLDTALPWAPTMGFQGARALHRLAFTDPGAKVAAVLRPCEARAAIELIKLGQIKDGNILFITVDCPGTVELKAFAESGQRAEEASEKLVASAMEGKIAAPAGLGLRKACTVCENPESEWGAVRLCIHGCDLEIEAEGDVAESLEKCGLASFGSAPSPQREKTVAALKAARSKARDELFRAFDGTLDGFKKEFSSCIKCLNCMENCPICYCKVCIFKSPLFDHEGERYARWAARKGAQKLPAETALFHMTRLAHMASSCIGCGLCDTACPMGLPVAALFRKTAASVQAMLGYEAGRSLTDDIPVSTFREDELQAQSGAKDH